MTMVGTAVKSTLVLVSASPLKSPKFVSLVICDFFLSIMLQDKATSAKGRGTYFFASDSTAIFNSAGGIFGISITDVNTELFGKDATTLWVVTPERSSKVFNKLAACLIEIV